jgi:carbonic anhydrase
MKQGNERFRKGAKHTHNYIAEQKASAKGQHPAAVILSCIDSRAPAEVIMDLGIGDVFNSRVAGNISNDDRHPWQHGVRLQDGWSEGRPSNGTHFVRCD